MEKLTKSEMCKARRKILAEIDRLNKKRCDFCSSEIEGNSYEERSKCNCPAAVEIRMIGNQLMKLVSKRKIVDAELPPMPNVEGITIDNLTIGIYEQLKSRKMTDTQIMRQLSVGTNKFHKWKKESGLSASVKAPKRKKEEATC